MIALKTRAVHRFIACIHVVFKYLLGLFDQTALWESCTKRLRLLPGSCGMFVEQIPPRARPGTGPKMGSVSERDMPQLLPRVDISPELRGQIYFSKWRINIQLPLSIYKANGIADK